MAKASGKLGSVKVGVTSYTFAVWNVNIKTDAVDVTNFTSNGFQENLDGITGAEITLSGPFDDAMDFTSGQVYTFVLGVTPALSMSVPARITNIRPIADTKDAVRVEITAQSTGAFTPSLPTTVLAREEKPAGESALSKGAV